MVTSRLAPTGDDTVDAISELVRDWGLREVLPRFRALEDKGEFPRDLYRQMGELGFFGCCFPEEMGGTGSGFRALAAVSEQLAWVYPPLSACMNLPAPTIPPPLPHCAPHPHLAPHLSHPIPPDPPLPPQ